MLNITEQSKKKLIEKYKIDVNKYNKLNDLLEEIDEEMTAHVDKDDEPLPEFLELEKIYDEIYDANIKNT